MDARTRSDADQVLSDTNPDFGNRASYPQIRRFPQYSGDLMRDGHVSVLVIEDEADIRQLLRTLLEREGFTVSEATEGRDGVRQFH